MKRAKEDVQRACIVVHANASLNALKKCAEFYDEATTLSDNNIVSQQSY